MRNIIHSFIHAMIFLFVAVNSTLELKTWIWVYPNWVIGFSVGQTHVTYGHDYYENDHGFYMLEYLDLITNETVNIVTINYNEYNDSGIIAQKKGTNSLQNNTYIIQGLCGKIVSANLTIVEAQWCYNSSQYKSHLAVFANTTKSYFELLQSATNCSIYYNSSTTYMLLKIYQNSKCITLRYSQINNNIYVLTQNYLINQTVFSVISMENYTQIYTSIFAGTGDGCVTDMKISNKYYGIRICETIQLFFSNNYSSFRNVSILQLTAFSISDSWLYVAENNQFFLHQYDIETGFLFDKVLNQGFSDIEIIQSTNYLENYVIQWDSAIGIKIINVMDKYRCTGGCNVCIKNYQIDDLLDCCHQQYCTRSTNSSTNSSAINPSNLTNSTNSSAIDPSNLTNSTNSSAIDPSNLTNSTNSSAIDPSNLTNLTNSSTNSSAIDPSNLTNLTNSSLIPSLNLTNSTSYNHSNISIFQYQFLCNKKCKFCFSFDNKKCAECSVNLKMTDENSGTCQVETSMKNIIYLTNIGSTFRITKLQTLYFLLDNLELYQYHSNSYQGVTKTALEQIQFFSNERWKLFPEESISDWINEPFDQNIYANYTTSQFLSIERRDAQLFQSTKAYYICFVPGTFIIFLLLNRLFYLVRNYRISAFLRIYSFWLQFLFLVVFSNSTRISFLFFQYTKLFFSFSTFYSVIHCLSMVLFGLFLIAFLSLFYMSYYNYGPLSKYFLINMYRIKYAFTLTFFLNSIRPIIEAAIHSFLFQNNFAQLISLSVLELTFVSVSLCFEFKLSIFKSKVILLNDICLSFTSVLMNLFLICKFYLFNAEGNSDIYDLFEQFLVVIFNVKGFLMILSLLYALILLGLSLICFKEKRKVESCPTEGETRTAFTREQPIFKRRSKKMKTRYEPKQQLSQKREKSYYSKSQKNEIIFKVKIRKNRF